MAPAVQDPSRVIKLMCRNTGNWLTFTPMTEPLIQFTLLIPVNKRVSEFNFRQRSPETYDGNTTDERGERYYFQLIRKGDQWQFADTGLPRWLKEQEGAVSQAMIDREASSR